MTTATADTGTQPDSSPVEPGRVGVLLVNLGTPDATDYWSMRRYLKEFLSDRRVIELTRWIWWPVLNLIILTTRPSRSGRNYEAIWNRERDESPLRTYTRAQAEKLDAAIQAGAFGKSQRSIVVDWAMRYGNPSIASRLEALQAQGCDRILCVPLYPQYAASSSATVADKVFDKLKTMRWQPAIRIAPPWFDDPVYIEALAHSVRAALAGLDFEPQAVVASYHGLPKAYCDKGDPYDRHCAVTTQLLRQALGYADADMPMAFQSRFGAAKWLEPYLDATMKALPGQGVKRVAVIAPGFVADCLETIEEIGVENRDFFLAAGGEKFARIDCLNDSDDGMKVIAHVVRRELQGWI
jgi:ferrochelatase